MKNQTPETSGHTGNVSRSGRHRRWRNLLPDGSHLRGGIASSLVTTTATLVAWLPVHALGLQEGIWAAITAIFVSQPELKSARLIARDQFSGAAIGGLSSLAIILTAADAPGGKTCLCHCDYSVAGPL